MAKGNDGNYLQHSVEVAVALHLASLQPGRRLHIALTHGMAPFEECDWRNLGRRLKAALQAAHGDPKPNEPPIVTAYRASGARVAHYPNTAELLRAMLGADCLAGGITEWDGDSYSELLARWDRSRVRVRLGSWRSEVHPTGVLACRSALDHPWLFSMDPMSYTEGHFVDDDYLHLSDRDRLIGVLEDYVLSDQPGVASIFVYNVQPALREGFWRFVDQIGESLSVSVVYCWLPHSGPNRNLAALLCSGCELPTSWIPPGVTEGRC